MYLTKKDHVSRYIPYKRQLRDDNDEPVGFLPQGFKMRENRDEKDLSVDWLEYFGKSHAENIVSAIAAFIGRTRNKKIGKLSVFGIANVGKLEEICTEHQHTKVRIVHNEKKNSSHGKIVRLPINDPNMMQILATEVFKELVRYKDVADAEKK